MSIKKLQSKLGLKPDGNIGPVTAKAIAKHYKLTPEQCAHFLGQTAHETGNFRTFSENLNYSEAGLLKVFPKYFNAQTAKQYARQPERIANRVYANRMGNGPEESGDGWKYRGRGALQTTGFFNYKALSEFQDRPEILINPDLVATDFVFESAIYFFTSNRLWAQCSQGVNKNTILAVTKRVNGGTHGLADREAKTLTYYALLK